MEQTHGRSCIPRTIIGTQNRNQTNDRNDPNNGTETNQMNDANVFTCWTKQCLKLNFEPKVWFKNMNVT